MPARERTFQQFREKLLRDMLNNGYTDHEVGVIQEALGVWEVTNRLVYAFAMGFGKSQRRSKKKEESKAIELPADKGE